MEGMRPLTAMLLVCCGCVHAARLRLLTLGCQTEHCGSSGVLQQRRPEEAWGPQRALHGAMATMQPRGSGARGEGVHR